MGCTHKEILEISSGGEIQWCRLCGALRLNKKRWAYSKAWLTDSRSYGRLGSSQQKIMDFLEGFKIPSTQDIGMALYQKCCPDYVAYYSEIDEMNDGPPHEVWFHAEEWARRKLRYLARKGLVQEVRKDRWVRR